MTPKLRLRLDDKKVLLSSMRKLRCPGIRWMIKSTQMMLDPTMQADNKDQNSASEAVCYECRIRCSPNPLTQLIIHPLVSLSKDIVPACGLTATSRFLVIATSSPNLWRLCSRCAPVFHHNSAHRLLTSYSYSSGHHASEAYMLPMIGHPPTSACTAEAKIDIRFTQITSAI